MSTDESTIPPFDHTHDALTTVGVLAFTALTAIWASWLVADLGVRWPTFALAAIASGYYLYDRADGRSVLATGLYLVAGLVALTPIMFVVPLLLAGGRPGVGNPWVFVFTIADLQAFVAFLLVAAVPAIAGFIVSEPGSVRERLASVTGNDG